MYHSRSSSTSCSLANCGSSLRERNHVESQVPGGVPGILPVVRHGDDVAIVEMLPVVVAAVLAARRRRRLRGIAFQPLRHASSDKTAWSTAGRRRPAARCGATHRYSPCAATWRRTHRPRPAAARTPASASSGRSRAIRRTAADGWSRSRPDRAPGGTARRPWCLHPADSRASARPSIR